MTTPDRLAAPAHWILNHAQFFNIPLGRTPYVAKRQLSSFALECSLLPITQRFNLHRQALP